MEGMFKGAASFSGDITSWEVSLVISMEGMFDGASSFSGDLSSWGVSGVIDMTGMFRDATSFDKTLCWNDVSADTTDMFAGSGGGSLSSGCDFCSYGEYRDSTDASCA